MFKYLTPLNETPFEATSIKRPTQDVSFKPTMAFHEFADLLDRLSVKLPRLLDSQLESANSLRPDKDADDRERLVKVGEFGLISKRIGDVSHALILFSSIRSSSGLKLSDMLKPPDIVEYTNSTFDGTTLTTEPRVSLRKICDYLKDICNGLAKGTITTGRSWDLTDTAELLYLLGEDVSLQEPNEKILPRIDERFTRLAEETGIILRGRKNAETKQELWNELESKLSDGLRYQIKSL